MNASCGKRRGCCLIVPVQSDECGPVLLLGLSDGRSSAWSVVAAYSTKRPRKPRKPSR